MKKIRGPNQSSWISNNSLEESINTRRGEALEEEEDSVFTGLMYPVNREGWRCAALKRFGCNYK